MHVTARYAVATLTPLAFLLLGASVRGEFAVAALVWLTLAAALLDMLPKPPAAARDASRPADRLCLLIGVAHLALLPVVLIALAGPDLGFGQKAALFLATALYIGQVSHPTAHELIHHGSRAMRWLGGAVYTSVGFGHHVSAHRLVHHRDFGTNEDPNTPLPGEDYWTYLPRAWSESFRAGLAAEEARLEAGGRGPRNIRNPYFIWVGGEAVALMLAAVVAGPIGVLAFLGLIVLSGAQILLFDYVQHYGLQRLDLPSGGLEPAAAHQGWSTAPGFSTYLMMDAPTHSEHHPSSNRRGDASDSGTDAPRLPLPLPVMATLAAIPPLWRLIMDRRARRVMQAARARLTTQSAPDDAPSPSASETGTETPSDPTASPTPTRHPVPAKTAYSGRADLSPLPHVAEEDDALIAKVQDLVSLAPVTPRERPGEISLKLRRPVRSARRAALRDP